MQKITPHQTVTLIAPSPDSYTLPTSRKLISGGVVEAATTILFQHRKGRLPKVAMHQITPPAIVMRNEHPQLAC